MCPVSFKESEGFSFMFRHVGMFLESAIVVIMW